MLIFCNYLARARFARTEGGEVVHFSGFARKMNDIPLFYAVWLSIFLFSIAYC
ncbi:MAG: hypothetical protein U5L45_05125 [Saprospiraceae bacterium]|nr:hypothetical protein [Saprospiraceae bacterium]